MLKNLSSLEHAIEGKAYQFLCDPNSPLNHVKDALVKFLGYVQQIEDQAKAAKDAQDAKDEQEAQEAQAAKEAKKAQAKADKQEIEKPKEEVADVPSQS